MENATIAHECSPLGRGNDLTKWIHTILSGHRHTCFIQTGKFGSFPRLLQFIVPKTLLWRLEYQSDVTWKTLSAGQGPVASGARLIVSFRSGSQFRRL